MSRKFILTLWVTLLPFVASAQLKVGIMNPEEVVEAMPETEQVQRDLEQYMRERQDDFTAQYSSWIEAVTNLEERIESGTISEQERQEEEQRLMSREEELGNLERRIQGQIQERQNELIAPIMNRVEEAMNQVASELDLDYVLNRQTSQGEPLVYYASDRSIDITDRVIAEITSN